MSDFKLGEHEAMIRTLDTRTAAIAEDVASIKNMLAEQRGERRAAMKIGALAGGLVSLLLPLCLKVVGLVIASFRST